MQKIFVIEDEMHSDHIGEFETFETALEELRRIASINWDENPNRAPCQSWVTCGRDYEIVEYNKAMVPWAEIRRIPVLSVSAKEVRWKAGFAT